MLQTPVSSPALGRPREATSWEVSWDTEQELAEGGGICRERVCSIVIELIKATDLGRRGLGLGGEPWGQSSHKTEGLKPRRSLSPLPASLSCFLSELIVSPFSIMCGHVS